MQNTSGTPDLPTFNDVAAARGRISGAIHRTPVLSSCGINALAGATVHFKCENLQKTGSFKARGALNAVLSGMEAGDRRPVAAHSSGNHGQALAWGAATTGLEAHIVVPEGSNPVKVAAMRGYGGMVTFCPEGSRGRADGLAAVVAATGAREVHPSNDFHVIAGQGTAALELFEELSGLDLLFVPLGGGGLLSGSLLAMSQSAPSCRVIGVEPAIADDGRRSLAAGRIVPSDYPDTVADGLKTGLGSRTFPLIQRYVHDIVTVTEEEIRSTLHLALGRLKLVIEPSSAVALAAVLSGRTAVGGRRVGVLLSGGNLNLTSLPAPGAGQEESP